MKNIFVSVSAVPLSLAKLYMAGFDRSRYKEFFKKFSGSKNAYRIYLPMTGSMPDAKIVKVPQSVSDEVEEAGYNIDNYLVGLAISPDRKRTIRIGKLLKSEKAKKDFANDPVRGAAKVGKDGELLIVISRHPYDIIGSSFDRGWTSCMGLGKTNSRYLKKDIEHGSLVAYLVRNTDKNINNPIARALIKPYSNGSRTILSPDTVYGTAGPGFKKALRSFCAKYNGEVSDGIYAQHPELYDDGSGFIVKGPISAKQLLDMGTAITTSVARTTDDRKLIDELIDEAVFAVVQNPNLTKEDFARCLTFSNASAFAEYCPYEDLVFALPEDKIDFIAAYYAGEVTTKENAKTWMKIGGNSGQMSKQLFCDTLNTKGWAVEDIGQLTEPAHLCDVGYADIPNLKTWVKNFDGSIAQNDNLLINRFSLDVKRDILLTGKSQHLSKYLGYVNDDAQIEMLIETVPHKLKRLRNLTVKFNERLAKIDPFYIGVVWSSRRVGMDINFPIDAAKVMSQLDDESLLALLSGLYPSKLLTTDIQQLISLIPSSKWWALAELRILPQEDDLIPFFDALSDEQFKKHVPSGSMNRWVRHEEIRGYLKNRFNMEYGDLKALMYKSQQAKPL